MSRSEASKKIGCTPSALCKIENGQVLPKKATITSLCFVTRTPLARFYLLALEPRDFAPYPSVADCCTCMRESGSFSDEEIESVAKRLTK